MAGACQVDTGAGAGHHARMSDEELRHLTPEQVVALVRRLESPQLSLDDAMKLFEEGVALSRECQKQLEEAEGRVEILLKKADGKLAAEPFDPERESES